MDHLHFCFENQMGDCNFECNSGIEQGWLRLLRTKIARKFQHTTFWCYSPFKSGSDPTFTCKNSLCPPDKGNYQNLKLVPNLFEFHSKDFKCSTACAIHT